MKIILIFIGGFVLGSVLTYCAIQQTMAKRLPLVKNALRSILHKVSERPHTNQEIKDLVNEELSFIGIIHPNARERKVD